MTTRTRRTFWALLVVAILASGALSRTLTAEPGPAAGLGVAASALLLAISGSLALRILVVAERHAAGRTEPRER